MDTLSRVIHSRLKQRLYLGVFSGVGFRGKTCRRSPYQTKGHPVGVKLRQIAILIKTRLMKVWTLSRSSLRIATVR
jgi:hypothetical protein